MTNQTPESMIAEAQVLAAAKALRADEGFMAEVHSALEVSWSEYIARLALAAAAGATPQAESAQPWNDEADPNSPRFDSPWEKAAALLSTLRGAQFDLLTRRDPVEVQDEVNGLINRLDELVAAMLAAPVQPSITVDEAALIREAKAEARGEALIDAVQAHRKLHETYGSTSVCHGGIGGQVMTPHCAEICDNINAHLTEISAWDALELEAVEFSRARAAEYRKGARHE